MSKIRAKRTSKSLKSKGADEADSNKLDESIFNISDDELCSICCAERVKYICPSCKCQMCNSCLKKYITEYANLEPHCMQCQTLLPFMVMMNALGKDGFKAFLHRSVELRFQIEVQRIPECLDCCNEITSSAKLNDVNPKLASFLYEAARFRFPSEREFNNYGKINPAERDLIDKFDQTILEFYDKLFHSIKETIDKNEEILSHCEKEVIKIPTDTGMASRTRSKRKALTNEDDDNKISSKHKTIRVEDEKYKSIYNIPEESRNEFCSMGNKHIERLLLFTATPTLSYPKREYIEALERIYKLLTPVPFSFFHKADGRTMSIDAIIARYDARSRNRALGKAKKQEFMFRCEVEDCKGFVGMNFVCKLCGQRYCDKCFKPVESSSTNQHVCKPEDVESAKMIEESTKPCPNCAARIFKISGCSQMFCTNCHVGFDWNTGKIINSNFHNPHRNEWLNQLRAEGKDISSVINGNGDGVLDGAGNGDCINVSAIVGMNSSLVSYNNEARRRYSQYNHFKNVVIPKWMSIKNSLGKYDFRNRVLYVMNKMSEEEFKKYLELEVRDKHKMDMLNKIYGDFIVMLGEILVMAVQEYRNFNDNVINKHINAVMLNRFWEITKTKGVENEMSKAMNELYEKMQKNWISLNELNQTISNISPFYPKVDPKYIPIEDFIKIFRQTPCFDKYDELMNKITTETCNALKQYKRIFGISVITVPTNLDEIERGIYYKVV